VHVDYPLTHSSTDYVDWYRARQRAFRKQRQGIGLLLAHRRAIDLQSVGSELEGAKCRGGIVLCDRGGSCACCSCRRRAICRGFVHEGGQVA
jgi:hypothetical protein